MPANRLIRAVSFALLAAALVAPTAQAATTVEVDRASDINLDVLAFGVTAACGFTVELHSVGKEVTISRYDDGVLVSQTIQIVYDGYLLNPANGRTVSSKVAGPERSVYNADGTIAVTSTGSTHRNAPGGGLLSAFIGRDHFVLVPTGELDEDGFPIYDFADESTQRALAGQCRRLRRSSPRRSAPPAAAAVAAGRPLTDAIGPGSARPPGVAMPANRRRPAVLGMAALIVLSIAACGAGSAGRTDPALRTPSASSTPATAAAASAVAPDVTSLTPQAVIDVPGANGAIAIAAGPDAVWIGADREVIRVDPTDNTTTSIPVPIDDGSWTGIHIDGDQLWASDFYGDSLVHVDLATGTAVRIPTEHPTGPAWSTAGIWLAAEGTGALSRVDPATDTVDLELEADRTRKYPSIIGDRVWHGDRVDGKPFAVWRDASTGEELGRIQLPEWTGCYFLPGSSGIVWTLGACDGDVRNAMAAIDPSTSTVASVDAPKDFIGTVAIVGETDWLVLGGMPGQDGRLVEYTRDGPTGRVVDLPPGVDPDNPVVAFGSIWIPADGQGKVVRLPIEDLDGG